jgi:hypothetical protein
MIGYARPPVRISALAWDVVRRNNGMEEQHTALTVPSPGFTMEERAELEKQATAELHAKGLMERGRVDPEFLEDLRTLDRPAAEVYGWIGQPGQTRANVLVATNGHAPIKAVLADNDQTFHLIPLPHNENLVTSLLRSMPSLNPGRATASAPMAKVDAAVNGAAKTASQDDVLGWGRQTGDSRKDQQQVEQILAIIRTKRLGGGILYAAARDRLGRRRRADEFLKYLDTVEGRWLQYRHPGPEGEQWVSVVPGSPEVMAEQLNRLMNSIPAKR